MEAILNAYICIFFTGKDMKHGKMIALKEGFSHAKFESNPIMP